VASLPGPASSSTHTNASAAASEADAGSDAAVEPDGPLGDGAPTACSVTDPRNPPITLTVQPDDGSSTASGP
jgi:hypothetical protein